MKYYALIVNDSGAIELIDYKYSSNNKLSVCKMYDDSDYNSLNDILHSVGEHILSPRTLKIFQKFNLKEYQWSPAKVVRKEKLFNFIKINKSYDYYNLEDTSTISSECYDWIDFEKSEVYAIDNLNNQIKIKSHNHTLDLINENKSQTSRIFDFKAEVIAFGNKFDSDVDMFNIPFYSWATYISQRMKNKLEESHITDIQFAEHKNQIGKMWKDSFPTIKFLRN